MGHWPILFNMRYVESTQLGALAVIRIARPPVNSLSRAVREQLLESLGLAQADRSIQGVVLTGVDSVFSAGADIHEFAKGLAGDAFASPGLGDVCTRLSGAAKPVVAAINGVCMGGGMELALACHSRVLGANAKLALPEIKLGLLPGAGGTQRLPRLIGVAAALPLILSAETIDARRAAHLGIGILSDPASLLHVAEQELRRLEGLSAVERVAPPPSWSAPDEEKIAAIDAIAAKLPRATPAEQGVIAAIRAAVELPLEDGLCREIEIFRDLIQTSEARALQYAFFGDRTASRIDSVGKNARSHDIRHVAVIGAGTMGVGIAMTLANAGLETTLIDPFPDALQRGINRIESTYTGAVQKGRLGKAEAMRRRHSIRASGDISMVAQADLIIEAVPESLDLKRKIFEQLDAHAHASAILATNTSTLDVNVIAKVTHRPADVIGLHFFNPANVMRLLEVVRSEQSSDTTIVTAMQFARRIGKVAVLARVCDGFIGNACLKSTAGKQFSCSTKAHFPRRSTAHLNVGAWLWGRSRCSTWQAETSPGPFASVAQLSSPIDRTRRFPTRSANWAGSVRKPVQGSTGTIPSLANVRLTPRSMR